MAYDAVAHSFKTLGIVGTGAMGRGIAQLAAQAGLDVMLFDVKDGAVAEATAFIHGLWQRSADKQRITQAQAEQYGERLIEALQGFLPAAVGRHLVALLGDRVRVVGTLVRVVLYDRNCLCHQPLTSWGWRGL